MERYHFKTHEQRDARGIELASLAAAKCEAGKVMASIVCASADEPWQRSEWTVTVTDDRVLRRSRRATGSALQGLRAKADISTPPFTPPAFRRQCNNVRTCFPHRNRPRRTKSLFKH